MNDNTTWNDGDIGLTGTLFATGTIAIVMILLIAGLWVGGAYLEGRAYRRVTGKNVTTLDAMFLELRVQAPPDTTSR